MSKQRIAKNAATKITTAINKLPKAEELTPLIIVYMLLAYKQYGLAAIVQKGWRKENVG